MKSKGKRIGGFNSKLGLPAIFILCLLFFLAGLFGSNLLSQDEPSDGSGPRLLESVAEDDRSVPHGETGESGIASIPFQSSCFRKVVNKNVPLVLVFKVSKVLSPCLIRWIDHMGLSTHKMLHCAAYFMIVVKLSAFFNMIMLHQRMQLEFWKKSILRYSYNRILVLSMIRSLFMEKLLGHLKKQSDEAFLDSETIEVEFWCTTNSSSVHLGVEYFEQQERSTTALAVTASFETAFEVDKQVAAAVKSAFVKLASCRSINKDEFKELLRKISQHPDIDEGNQDLSELSSECESDTAAEFDPGFHRDSLCSQDLKLDCEKAVEEVRERKYKKKQPFQKFNTTKLVDMMLERLRCLQEDELASLAIIVATCGLNAALEEAENIKQPDLGSASDYTSARALRRISSVGGGARKQFEAELPSLDKFLVKCLTKLEREVLEAKNARLNDKEIEEMKGNIPNPYETRGMKLERSRTHNGVMRNMKQDITDLPSLDKYLVKHVSKLEREVQEAKNRRDFEPTEGGVKEELVRVKRRDPNTLSDTNEGSLDQILVKHKSRLEKEKLAAAQQPDDRMTHFVSRREARERELQEAWGGIGLGNSIHPHVSRLEQDKACFSISLNKFSLKRRDPNTESENTEGSLDQILVKHISRLEKEKIAAAQQLDDQIKHSVSRRDARERELQQAWGGLNFGNSLHPHVSRLERDKASFLTEEEERRNAMEVLYNLLFKILDRGNKWREKCENDRLLNHFSQTAGFDWWEAPPGANDTSGFLKWTTARLCGYDHLPTMYFGGHAHPEELLADREAYLGRRWQSCLVESERRLVDAKNGWKSSVMEPTLCKLNHNIQTINYITSNFDTFMKAINSKSVKNRYFATRANPRLLVGKICRSTLNRHNRPASTMNFSSTWCPRQCPCVGVVFMYGL
ncbi:hypothetical protein RHMOL_Rhmol11G0232800 [Rhododendron molle]|uniref:Uncharacterized protein n=1 Tax=Rhododendron molle TaxID=49168 RepID=A0ACC0LVI4_RHOML|nr:hypothetical protein RHMOL_Rhmol11G0232800 [Rhododendron molle]